MGREDIITREVKRHDSKLYCERNKEGMPCIFRKSSRYENYQLEDGSWLVVSRPAPHFIFALSDNWKTTGRPVPWGVLPILERLRALDLWNRDIVSEIEENYEKEEKSNARQFRNNTESFLIDFRKQFARATNDINTGTLAKKDSRRIKRIKE